MKLKHIAIIGSLFPILFSLVLFFGVLISADSDDENSNFSSGITGMNLSAEVLKHQPMVEKYARENGISEYVNDISYSLLCRWFKVAVLPLDAALCAEITKGRDEIKRCAV